jgi:serine kinase of HPr protein (carbohydrate metabolism regulator)
VNVSRLTNELKLTVFAGEGELLSRPVTGGYIGDLLSWVMGRAEPGCAWITIMQNVNVAAVAVLADVACVILAEGVTPDAALLDKARTQSVALLGSSLPAFALAQELHKRLQR